MENITDAVDMAANEAVTDDIALDTLAEVSRTFQDDASFGAEGLNETVEEVTIH